jgi:hypothetical protein
MGTFYYGGAHGDPPTGFDVDDALLAHLQQVILAKLRRHESFLVTLPALEHGREVREALWMNPAVPMRFVLDEVERLPLDLELLEVMMMEANTVSGIVLRVASESLELHLDSADFTRLSRANARPIPRSGAEERALVSPRSSLGSR